MRANPLRLGFWGEACLEIRRITTCVALTLGEFRADNEQDQLR
jgi:hypothetical protein